MTGAAIQIITFIESSVTPTASASMLVATPCNNTEGTEKSEVEHFWHNALHNAESSRNKEPASVVESHNHTIAD